MKAMTRYIKELEQPGTWNIVSINSVNGAHILPSTCDFNFKHFPGGILFIFKAIFCARVIDKWS